MRNNTVKLDGGGEFSYGITNKSGHPDKNGMYIYIASVHAGFTDNGKIKKNSHTVERMLNFIIDNLPQVQFIRAYPVSNQSAKILKKAIERIFGETIEIKSRESFVFHISPTWHSGRKKIKEYNSLDSED